MEKRTGKRKKRGRKKEERAGREREGGERGEGEEVELCKSYEVYGQWAEEDIDPRRGVSTR